MKLIKLLIFILLPFFLVSGCTDSGNSAADVAKLDAALASATKTVDSARFASLYETNMLSGPDAIRLLELMAPTNRENVKPAKLNFVGTLYFNEGTNTVFEVDVTQKGVMHSHHYFFRLKFSDVSFSKR